MKLLHMLAAAAIGMCVWGSPARAMVAPPPRAPGPAPVGYAYEYVTPVYQTVTQRTWIPGRVETVIDWLEIAPGRWQQVERPIVSPGHYEMTTRQVQVSPGHWELVRIDVPPVIIVPRPVVMTPGTVGVDCYSSGPGEDLSKFSPLTEWPK